MNANSERGIAPLLVLGILAALGVGVWAVKPSLFPGDARRAAASSATTQRLADANDARGGTAAAILVKIGEVNAGTPESPAKTFISREVPLALTFLGAPDPGALAAAEARRAAVMEGRAVEAEKLYAGAATESARLAKALALAEAAKRSADLALETAAAAEHARTQQLLVAGAIAVVLAAGWVWAKVNGIHPDLIGKMQAEIAAGAKPLVAMNKFIAPRFHAGILRARKLATEVREEFEREPARPAERANP